MALAFAIVGGPGAMRWRLTGDGRLAVFYTGSFAARRTTGALLHDLYLSIDNLQGLRQIRWRLSGLNVLIGANGSGKSTLLLALKLLRTALDRGLPEAASLVLGGSHGLKHWDALEDEPVQIALEVADLRWSVRLRTRGATVDALSEETLTADGRTVYHSDSLGNLTVGDVRWERKGERLALSTILASQEQIEAVTRMAEVLARITVFHDADLYGIRVNGSNVDHTRHLHARGQNALAMLERWGRERPDRWRRQAVVEGLKAAFPGLFQDLDLLVAGKTVVGRIYRPGHETPYAMEVAANGIIAMMVDLCALMAAEPGGVVAVDEVGGALHPYAIRVFMRIAERHARARGLTVILATHNTVLLDHMQATPEQVFVLENDQWPGPTPLTALRSAEWLAEFRIGDRYANDSFGSNLVETEE